jgi:hypothetical protein
MPSRRGHIDQLLVAWQREARNKARCVSEQRRLGRGISTRALPVLAVMATVLTVYS